MAFAKEFGFVAQLNLHRNTTDDIWQQFHPKVQTDVTEYWTKRAHTTRLLTSSSLLLRFDSEELHCFYSLRSLMGRGLASTALYYFVWCYCFSWLLGTFGPIPLPIMNKNRDTGVVLGKRVSIRTLSNRTFLITFTDVIRLR